MAGKKKLIEIVNMSDEELLEYYNSRELLNEGVNEIEDEYLGAMTEEELVRKYHLISDANAQSIIEEKFHLSDYPIKNS